jgi:hypothetical protein
MSQTRKNTGTSRQRFNPPPGNSSLWGGNGFDLGLRNAAITPILHKKYCETRAKLAYYVGYGTQQRAPDSEVKALKALGGDSI